MVLGYFIFFYLITLSLFKFKSIQFNSIIHISKKNMDKNFVNFELFQLQFFSTVVLGYFIFFISVHFFCPIQFNFIFLYLKKEHFYKLCQFELLQVKLSFPTMVFGNFSVQCNQFNSIQFQSILSHHTSKKNTFKKFVNF